MAFSSIAKNLNEKIVLDCIKDGASYTKQEIAKQSELSFPTVSKIVDEFVAKKIMLSLGIQENSQGGRKAALFQLNKDFAHVLTLFIQEKSIYSQVVDTLGNTILNDEKEYTVPLSFTQIVEIIRQTLQEDTLIHAISIGIPGSVHNGKIYDIDGYEALKECELEKELYKLFSIPVKIGNNMNIIALGMADKLACKEDNIACIHLAQTGPGCGAVVNGKAVSGFCGFNGEVGFIPFYDKKTLQEIALSGFQNIHLGDFIGKIAICLITILNPKKIVLYIEREEKDWENDMRSYCRTYLPERVLPEFIISTRYQEEYFYGLTIVGTELLFEEISNK